MKALIILLLSIVTFVTALETRITLFFHLTYLLLGLLVLAYAWAWSNLQGLAARRQSSNNRAQVGEFVSEHLVVENHWPLGKLWVEVRDHSDLPYHQPGFVSYIPRRGERHWVSRTPCMIRGKFTLGPVTFHTGDPFGIFQVSRMDSSTSEVLVYPGTVDLSRFALPLAELQGGQDVRQRTPHSTPNVATIRDYVAGDTFNRIHWLSTARTGRLMVKEFELDPDADLWLVLDMQEEAHQSAGLGTIQPFQTRPGQQMLLPPSTEEYGVALAASLGRHLLHGGRQVGLLSWGQHREVIPPAREARQLFKILEALAVLRAHGTYELTQMLAGESFRFSRNTSLLIITPSANPRWPDGLQQMLSRGVRPTVFFIDPQSFDGWQDPVPVLARLQTMRVPVHEVRKGELTQSTVGPSTATSSAMRTRVGRI